MIRRKASIRKNCISAIIVVRYICDITLSGSLNPYSLDHFTFHNSIRFRISDFRSQDSGEQVSRLYSIKFDRFPRTPRPGRHSKGRDTLRHTVSSRHPNLVTSERRHDDDGGGARHDGGGLLLVRRRFGHHSHHVLRSVGLLSRYGGIGPGVGRQLWFRCQRGPRANLHMDPRAQFTGHEGNCFARTQVRISNMLHVGPLTGL